MTPRQRVTDLVLFGIPCLLLGLLMGIGLQRNLEKRSIIAKFDADGVIKCTETIKPPETVCRFRRRGQ